MTVSTSVPVVAVGGIRYETNSFVAPSHMDLTSLRRGVGVLSPLASTELAGAVASAHELGIELRGVLDVFGGCGGPADHAQFLQLLDEFCDTLAEQPKPDGIYLALHGAMTTTETDAAEVMLIERVRAIVGVDVPIVASLDLHAAVDDALTADLQGIVGFKTCPHVDYQQAGSAALRIMDAAIRGTKRPQIHRLSIPMVTAAESHDTTTGPLAPHMARAVAHIDGDILDISIFAVQPWLDAARSTWSVTVTFDAPGGATGARTVARDVRDRLLADAPNFVPLKVLPAAAARMIVANSETPLLLADSGDSPSAGATGGSTDLLRHLVPTNGATVLASLTDAQAARRLSEQTVGTEMTLPIGGVADIGIEPLEMCVRVASVHDGHYNRAYPAAECDVGTCVVVTDHDLTLVITERPAFMLDASLFEHVGLKPSAFDAVVVKSAGGFRARWAPISVDFVTVDSGGASTSRLTSLPYRHADPKLFVTADNVRTASLKESS